MPKKQYWNNKGLFHEKAGILANAIINLLGSPHGQYLRKNDHWQHEKAKDKSTLQPQFRDNRCSKCWEYHLEKVKYREQLESQIAKIVSLLNTGYQILHSHVGYVAEEKHEAQKQRIPKIQIFLTFCICFSHIYLFNYNPKIYYIEYY